MCLDLCVGTRGDCSEPLSRVSSRSSRSQCAPVKDVFVFFFATIRRPRETRLTIDGTRFFCFHSPSAFLGPISIIRHSTPNFPTYTDLIFWPLFSEFHADLVWKHHFKMRYFVCFAKKCIFFSSIRLTTNYITYTWYFCWIELLSNRVNINETTF